MALPSQREDSRAVLILGVGAWAAAVAYAASQDVFARISPPAALALAILAAVGAPGALLLDQNLREHARRASPRALVVALVALLGVALLATEILIRRHGFTLDSVVSAPFAFVTYFVAPLAIALATAAAQRLGAAIRRSAPAKSPGARPGARRTPRTNARGAGAAGA